ncbi:hypothetical protein GJ744_001331 [Endocarpon pusillum]|uniref:Mitotic-spindle organizing protein 1 n=1 Tax=Endocarpon pusillum TaxID=364733 RepID=A0A8H7EA67_9EURO|nr:hypothetical protein GJ744_001331 [Endocarpon pusillum]
MPSKDSKEEKKEKAREVVDILEEISLLLNTHLDRPQLSLCVSLIENGVNPEALATAISDLRRDADDLQRVEIKDVA